MDAKRSFETIRWNLFVHYLLQHCLESATSSIVNPQYCQDPSIADEFAGSDFSGKVGMPRMLVLGFKLIYVFPRNQQLVTEICRGKFLHTWSFD